MDVPHDVTPREQGRVAYYRGENGNPYPLNHVYHQEWQAGWLRASEREAGRRAEAESIRNGTFGSGI